MKKSMMFAILALTAIVMLVSFDIQLIPGTVTPISPADAPNALYVCPAADQTWDTISQAMMPFTKFIAMLFAFGIIILLFVWGWEMYQNLLKDKFDKKSFSKVWGFSKFTFWAGVIVMLLIMTPNYFRTVRLDGAAGQWVLCDSNTPGNRPVRADMVRN